MKKLDVIAFESYQLGKQQKNVSIHLLDKLYEFLAKSYHLASPEEFLHLIIQPKEKGELVVLYGAKEDIAGFCRIIMQKVMIEDKQITAYTAYAYLNQDYNPYPSSASMGLTQGIKYKLDHPDEEVIYVAFANNPYTYESFYQLIESLYPKPSQQVPDQILKVINALKKQNGWVSTGSHPMIVNSSLVPIRSHTPGFQEEHTEPGEFYLATNTDYMQGNSLLIYIPLNLANINYGLNPPSHKSYFDKPPHHLYPQQEDSTAKPQDYRPN